MFAIMVDAEAEYLQEQHKDIVKQIEAIENTAGGIPEFCRQIRQKISKKDIEIIESIYGMSIEELIPFLKAHPVKLVGGEVRVHTAQAAEIEARMLAEKGVTVITMEHYTDSVSIYPWSFLTYTLGATGFTHMTSSHSAANLWGRKVGDWRGGQLTPEKYDLYRAILKRKVDELLTKGYTYVLGAADNKNIRKVLNYENVAALYSSMYKFTEEQINTINEATKKGHKIVVNCLNGSAYKTLLPILHKLGIDPSAFVFINKEEDRFFKVGYIPVKSKTGSGYVVEHYGCDTTRTDVARTMPYIDSLADFPVGTLVWELDPDTDRFVVKQIEKDTAAVRELLNKFSIISYNLGAGRILVAPFPNKSFLQQDILDIERKIKTGELDENIYLYFGSYVSTEAWPEFGDAIDELVYLMTLVGFKNFVVLRELIENWWFNHPEQEIFTVTDQLGHIINLFRDNNGIWGYSIGSKDDPQQIRNQAAKLRAEHLSEKKFRKDLGLGEKIVVFAKSRKLKTQSEGEESGGHVFGTPDEVYNILGKRTTAMPEKSAADALFYSLIAASEEYLKYAGFPIMNQEILQKAMGQGEYSFLKFLDSRFDKYGLQSYVDYRFDLLSGSAGAIALIPELEARNVEKAKCLSYKLQFNNFFFSIGKAVRDGKLSVKKAIEIFKFIMPEFASTWNAIVDLTMTEEGLAVGTRPEGVPIKFAIDPNSLLTGVKARPSATDEYTSKVYIDSRKIAAEDIKKLGGALNELQFADLYAVLKRFGIEPVLPKSELANFNTLELKQISSPVITPTSASSPVDVYQTARRIMPEVAKDNPFRNFALLGQYIWQDGLSIDMIESGYFEKRVAQDGINGVTTNPTLIKKYLESPKVQEKVRVLASQGKNAEEIYRDIVADLAEMVLGIFKKRQAKIGNYHFSVELNPAVNNSDVEQAVAEAMFWTDIDPDHMMIKVAVSSDSEGKDTDVGYQIIEEIIARGRNVNATLIFTPEHYRKVVQAYIRGLRRALDKVMRRELTNAEFERVYSVASFFISRWDVKLEEKKLMPDNLRGKAANAITTVAYNEIFLELFSENNPFWKTIVDDAGKLGIIVQVQDFLLASTGSKAGDMVKKGMIKPEQARLYPADIYVSPVQGRYVVNTLPDDTLKYQEQNPAKPFATIKANYSQAKADFQALEEHLAKNNTSVEIEGRGILKAASKSFTDDYNAVQTKIKDIIAEVNGQLTSSPVKVPSVTYGKDEDGDFINLKGEKIYITDAIDVAGKLDKWQAKGLIPATFIIDVHTNPASIVILDRKSLRDTDIGFFGTVPRTGAQVAASLADKLNYLMGKGGQRGSSISQGLRNEMLRRPKKSDKGKGTTSSPIKVEKNNPVGGIDFRSIPMTMQPMGSFAGLNFNLAPPPPNLAYINVDAELRQIQLMVQGGMIPSGQRIKELISACYYKKELKDKIGELVSSLSDICRLEEEYGRQSDPELKESLVLIDSAAL
ncbi:MAG: transaldolase family protein [Candidatus Omnitrophica bacterium]|nr:transaldolase family protein [Candidatus Omnitrophota bacterium]